MKRRRGSDAYYWQSTALARPRAGSLLPYPARWQSWSINRQARFGAEPAQDFRRQRPPDGQSALALIALDRLPRGRPCNAVGIEHEAKFDERTLSRQHFLVRSGICLRWSGCARPGRGRLPFLEQRGDLVTRGGLAAARLAPGHGCGGQLLRRLRLCLLGPRHFFARQARGAWPVWPRTRSFRQPFGRWAWIGLGEKRCRMAGPLKEKGVEENAACHRCEKNCAKERGPVRTPPLSPQEAPRPCRELLPQNLQHRSWPGQGEAPACVRRCVKQFSLPSPPFGTSAPRPRADWRPFRFLPGVQLRPQPRSRVEGRRGRRSLCLLRSQPYSPRPRARQTYARGRAQAPCLSPPAPAPPAGRKGGR